MNWGRANKISGQVRVEERKGGEAGRASAGETAQLTEELRAWRVRVPGVSEDE